ncbi:hypothetical protein FJ366_04165 [Candidatus Dependentiae bacterium]|nr:hypothetical protein [Candidatus Dependentiae bacterium]
MNKKGAFFLSVFIFCAANCAAPDVPVVALFLPALVHASIVPEPLPAPRLFPVVAVYQQPPRRFFALPPAQVLVDDDSSDESDKED